MATITTHYKGAMLFESHIGQHKVVIDVPGSMGGSNRGPTRLVNLKATVNLPQGDCGKRVKAIERVAEHCPVHATISTMEKLEVEILGQGACDLTPQT